MKLTHAILKDLIMEELTKADKDEIKRMISKEIDQSQKDFEKQLKQNVEEELEKLLKTAATKEEITDITKKILKKLYKDLALHHPYVIDRIKI
jgi:F0F1-type ATP synthase membrane subunit b/b'